MAERRGLRIITKRGVSGVVAVAVFSVLCTITVGVKYGLVWWLAVAVPAMFVAIWATLWACERKWG